jgi:predicted methyltransferase
MQSAVILLAAILALPVWAQDKRLSPGVSRAYEDADYARWQAMFETEGREVFDKRREIVAALDIRPGMTVADVGAGTGAFTALFSGNVGVGGTVIAQDISPEFIRGIESRARREKLANVRTVQGGAKDARLPPAGADLVFVCDSYHHFEYPQAMRASLHAALKPGGRLAVIDYEKIPGRSSAWVMGHVRAGREAVIAEIEAAGFRQLRSHALLGENFFVEFEKP